MTPLGPTATITLRDWHQAIAINLGGAFSGIHAVLPSMLDRGWGRIVNVSTAAIGGTGVKNGSAYAVSTTGLEMLTVNLAAELAGTGVTVNAIRPGSTDTAMQELVRDADPDIIGAHLVDRFKSVKANGQLNPPEYPARLILALIQDDRTGEVIDIRDARGQELVGRIAAGS